MKRNIERYGELVKPYCSFSAPEFVQSLYRWHSLPKRCFPYGNLVSTMLFGNIGTTPEFDLKEFSDRLSELIGGDRRVAAFARSVGISDTNVRNYLNGRTPGIDKVQQIAAATGVNIEWLVCGRGPMRGPDSAREAIQSEIDIRLMTSLITMVEEKLTEVGKSMLPAKKAELIAMMYAFCVIDSAPKKARDDSVKQMMNVMLKMAS